MKVTILGSGTSTGVPQIGCRCEVCTSRDPRDRRSRCSGLIEVDGVRILIDCGPDFREQMLRVPEFTAIDAVLITHIHYDHVGGIDDLRPFCQFRDIPIYAEGYTGELLKQMFPYCFAEKLYPGSPRIDVHPIQPGEPFSVSNREGREVTVTPFRVMHGKLPILGYRIGRMAWITDMLTMPDESYAHLRDLDLLVMNALRPEPHPTHQSIPEALEQVRRIRPRQTCFVHMSHHAGLHRDLDPVLPDGVSLAYDGMVRELNEPND
jgi:phosphoribosyl 1,2-cyclic phosphate phosphodiesterase